MNKAQTEINSTKTKITKKGRPRLLSEVERELVEKIIRGYVRDGRMTVSDEHVALRLRSYENIIISSETVRRIRIEIKIRALQRGGKRPGAGRPRKQQEKKRTYRKLKISDYDLVTKAARSVYECDPPIWDEKKAIWVKNEVWRIKKDETGRKIANLPTFRVRPGVPAGNGSGKRGRCGRSDINMIYASLH